MPRDSQFTFFLEGDSAFEVRHYEHNSDGEPSNNPFSVFSVNSSALSIHGTRETLTRLAEFILDNVKQDETTEEWAQRVSAMFDSGVA